MLGFKSLTLRHAPERDALRGIFLPSYGTTSFRAFIFLLDRSALFSYNDCDNGVCITVNVGAVRARNRAVTLSGQC